MPHKRNPEKCERVCGLARVLRANSIVALENVALWHERDISQSSAERVILPDSCLALDYILTLFTGIVSGLVVYPKRMLANMELTYGVVFSQRVLLALVEHGHVAAGRLPGRAARRPRRPRRAGAPSARRSPKSPRCRAVSPLPNWTRSSTTATSPARSTRASRAWG